MRQHLPRPAAIDPAAYRLTVNGMVSKPLQLTLADLQKLPQHTVPATLECTGNGRAFYTPKVPGHPVGPRRRRQCRVDRARGSATSSNSPASDAAAKFLEIDGAESASCRHPISSAACR